MEQKTELRVIQKVEVKEVPLLLDPYPLQDPKFTRISKFFENLKRGVLSTTKCPSKACGALHWPPRVVCPKCDSDELEWVDLPSTGKIYASSGLVLGHPIGFENEGPFATAMVELDGAGLRIFSRVDGCAPGELKIGDAVRFKQLELSDGRVWFRFERIA
ncbi:MAG TPA: Zn-ribbon domain-containing OB-fold protein [Thermoplasmata archaeon]|nr:Zn-ribbon domain-containing OB-fold protein [Thermoplasmata archaeon]